MTLPTWVLVDYWPWWLGAAFFGAFVVGMWLLERRLLGVSGSYTSVIERTRAEDEADRRLDEADPDAVETALMRATLAAFGPEALAAFEQEQAAKPAPAPALLAPRKLLPRSVHVVFLLALGVGGLLDALARGAWQLRFDLGPVHEALTGGGATSLAVLLVGGVLVGLGTRMAGGCTSGHGLSGCSRLVPASLAATASFFGTGVVVSFLLQAVMR